MEDILEIELKSFEKYKARSDVKKPTWFKCSNDLFDDDDLYAFSLEEMAVWAYIMAHSSKQQSKRVRISIRKASARITPELLRGTIEKLVALGIVSYPNTPTGRPRNGGGTPTDGSNTPDKKGFIGLEEIGEEETDPAADVPEKPPAEFLLLEGFGAVQELGHGPFLDAALRDIPRAVQQSWLERYDLVWLKSALTHAIEYHLAKAGKKWPNGVEDWGRKFDSWLGHEKNPKFKTKLREPRARAAPIPIEIPIVTAQEALSSASKMKLGSAAKMALARGLGPEAG